ncbi:hypothetical protein OS493_012325 [Desmophyllum pertusum]|uniref:TRAF-type domain-containing protein n=1 Tax=Desmophyllum pertusum TaxID=174260 RepID=A0A9X0D3J6_9CNID|nr:hypothetical protein OS493_012325 [Desmophyllum pertusum]
MARKEEQAHKQLCPKEDVTCECGLTLRREEKRGHKSSGCRFTDVLCPLMCRTSVKRYLMPSHSLACGRVVQSCQIEGCGQTYRRDEEGRHVEDALNHHWSLSQREREAMMWQVERSQIGVAAKRGSQKAVLKWNIPPGAVQQHQDLCSPLFNKFARKWRMHFRKQEVSLEYSQGLYQIVAFVRFIVQFESGKQRAYYDDVRVALKEGECISFSLTAQESATYIIAHIEVAEPEKFFMSF